MREIRDRIKEFRRIPAAELLENPKNWRLHEEPQRASLRAVLEEVGIAAALIAYERADGRLELIDGHLRREELEGADVPVLVLDVDEAEADKLLATVDPLAAMAGVDSERLDELLQGIHVEQPELRDMLGELALRSGILDPEFDPEPGSLPDLPDGDKEPLQQMAFVLHDLQADIVREAIVLAKAQGDFDDGLNANANGNALARIAEGYLNGHCESNGDTATQSG